ncbi:MULTISPECIES: MBL fold metallo-hydrolase [Halococcus]|uniref:Hydrolase (Hydroxyacylglutathione hydrolase) 8 n=1 Tax=Halococcus salifodinae DSM 8989 TaxID=1227456 RepID=M0NAR0_9EURY|nr:MULTISPECIES: MBL fold metallo-hydrolase [Halococcus]EMA55037.1 hydrolase (hydroxyacylglutathione hydrolase) 8 [Halococcus salifodinae DSM 8989]
MDAITVTEGAETFTCNAYLVDGERTVLIDAGTMDGVVDVIAEHVDDLDAVYLTHQHGDHVGALDAVLDEFDPELLAYADHPRRTGALDDGDVVGIGDEEFAVIHTPGHADDHVAFVSESTILSGDVVVHDDGAFEGGSFGRTDMAGQSREELIESIERILDRLPESVEHMYAGHGGEFHGDVRDVIETALSRAERREPKYPE